MGSASVSEEHGLDLSEHHAIPRIESTIRRNMAQRETPDIISIELPYLAYDAQNGVDIHFSGQMSMGEIQQAHLRSLPEVDLSIEDKQEALTAWVVSTFIEQSGVDISNLPDKIYCVGREVKQGLSAVEFEQGLNIKLPYLAYDVENNKDLHFQERLSASDLRKLFAEYHEQKSTFDVEAALEKVNQLYFECRFDELLTELENPNLQETTRGNTLLGKMLIHGYGSCERDVSKDTNFLLESVADNDARHQFWLGELLGHGTGGFEKMMQNLVNGIYVLHAKKLSSGTVLCI